MIFSKHVPLLFFSVFLIPLLNASEPKRCYNLSCRANNIDVSFPFWLFSEQSSSCGYPGFKLYCTDRHETALKLPNSGPFLVREIDLSKQRIRLNGPDNCLARRFLSFDTSDHTPFSPLYHVNYTFFSCPKEDVNKSSFFQPIHCLGNSTTSFFATVFEIAGSIPLSCQLFKTVLLSVSPLLTVNPNDQDLWLKWDSSVYRDRERNRSLSSFTNDTTLQVKWLSSFKSGLYNFILLVLMIICILVIGLLIVITTYVTYVMFSSDRLPTQIRRSLARRLVAGKRRSYHADQWRIIELYKIVELRDIMKLPGRNDIICPICLSEYTSSETVGCLLECEHCFHVKCVDEWLQLNSSCPICRNKVHPVFKDL